MTGACNMKNIKKQDIFLLVILSTMFCLAFGIFFLTKTKPNDKISQTDNSSNAFFVNTNPQFNIEFGDKKNPKVAKVRYTSSGSKNNPFEDSSSNFFQKILSLFQQKKEYGITMLPVAVKTSETSVKNSNLSQATLTKVAEVLGTQVLGVQTQVVESGREIGVSEGEQKISKPMIVNQEISNGVDLEYQILKGRGLKEEIVVDSRDSFFGDCTENNCDLPPNEFVFDIYLDQGVSLEDGWYTVNGRSTNLYYLTSPQGYIGHFLPSFAVDDNSNRTDSVDMSFTQKENNRYEVKVIVDLSWLLSEKTIYPVRIDPSIVFDDTADFSNGIFDNTSVSQDAKVQISQGRNIFPESTIVEKYDKYELEEKGIVLTVENDLLVKGISLWIRTIQMGDSPTVKYKGLEIPLPKEKISDIYWHNISISKIAEDSKTLLEIYFDGEPFLKKEVDITLQGNSLNITDGIFEIRNLLFLNISPTKEQILQEYLHNSGVLSNGVYTSKVIDISKNKLKGMSWDQFGTRSGDGEVLYSDNGLVQSVNFNDEKSLESMWGSGVLELKGTNVVLEKTTVLELNNSKAISVGIWAKRISNFGDLVNIDIVNGISGFKMSLLETGDIQVSGRSISSEPLQVASVFVGNTSDWHYYVGVLDFSNDQIQIFVDGMLLLTKPVVFEKETYSGESTVALGGSIVGFVDAFHLFNRGLTEDEILSNSQRADIQMEYRASSDGLNWGLWKGSKLSSLLVKDIKDQWKYSMDVDLKLDFLKDTDFVNFPLFLSFESTNLKSVANGGHVAMENGGDIKITKIDGTPLDFDIRKYDSVKGVLEINLTIPKTSEILENRIRIYYGNENIEIPSESIVEIKSPKIISMQISSKELQETGTTIWSQKDGENIFESISYFEGKFYWKISKDIWSTEYSKTETEDATYLIFVNDETVGKKLYVNGKLVSTFVKEENVPVFELKEVVINVLEFSGRILNDSEIAIQYLNRETVRDISTLEEEKVYQDIIQEIGLVLGSVSSSTYEQKIDIKDIEKNSLLKVNFATEEIGLVGKISLVGEKEKGYEIYNDFKANIIATNTVVNNQDLEFMISETPYGSINNIENLNIGNVIVLKEVVADKEYLAQGEVDNTNPITGEVKVKSWESESIFPPDGFSTNTSVYKWKEQYFQIDLKSIQNFKIEITKDIAIVNFKNIELLNNNINNPIESFEIAEQDKFFQYRYILTTEESVSPYIKQIVVDFNAIENPRMEQIMRHGKWFNDAGQKQPFWWTNK